MGELSRYNVSDEQAGLNQGILNNKLGYTNQKDLDDAETILQADAYRHFFDLAQTHQFAFDVNLLFEMHKYFFETLYSWAGSVRTVGFDPINYGKRETYLAACIAGASQNNESLQRIMEASLRQN